MKYYSLSDVGLLRDKNQDSYLAVFNKNNDFLAIVCDGVGGSNAGEVASSEACIYLDEKFKEVEFNSKEDVTKFIFDEMENCNKHILSLSNKYREYSGMATTLTGLLRTKFGDFIINVGDSRTYGIEENGLVQITEDHSLVNDLLKRGEITYEESLNHPKKHYLVNCLGLNVGLKIDVFDVKYDNYIICSDGLCGYVDDDEMFEIYKSKKTVQGICEAYINAALLKGGYDNITVIVVKK